MNWKLNETSPLNVNFIKVYVSPLSQKNLLMRKDRWFQILKFFQKDAIFENFQIYEKCWKIIVYKLVLISINSTTSKSSCFFQKPSFWKNSSTFRKLIYSKNLIYFSKTHLLQNTHLLLRNSSTSKNSSTSEKLIYFKNSSTSQKLIYFKKLIYFSKTQLISLSDWALLANMTTSFLAEEISLKNKVKCFSLLR